MTCELFRGECYAWHLVCERFEKRRVVSDARIGYYPASLFDTAGLRSKAEKVAFYGEIVDSGADSVSSWTDMGSGYWPSQHWTWAAYMSNLSYQSSTGGGMSRYVGSPWESNHSEYGIEEHFNDSGSWGSYCWVGGTGGG